MSQRRTMLLAIPDLMFGVRVAETARALGFTPVDAALAGLQEAVDDHVRLIIVDTGQPGDWQTAITTLKGDPRTAGVPILAYGAHVDVTALRAAVAAGVDRLVTRGKLMAELPQLLQAIASKTDTDTDS